MTRQPHARPTVDEQPPSDFGQQGWGDFDPTRSSLAADLLAAAAVIGALGGLYWKIDHSAYQRGQAEVQVKWDADVAARQKEAEADRARQDALRQAQDKETSRRLTNERKRATTLQASLDAHIRAAGSSVRCPMPPGLLDVWNRAGAGPTGEGGSPGPVPPARGAAPKAD